MGSTRKTVQKWRRRATAAAAPMGPKQPRSAALTPTEEAVLAFRRHTLLPLDDCLYALQPTVPHLTRSTLHRCLQCHGIARLPDTVLTPKRGRFRAYPIGYFHVDLRDVHAEEGRPYLFVAVDRTSKFAFARLHERAMRRIAAEFLEALAGRCRTACTRWRPRRPTPRRPSAPSGAGAPSTPRASGSASSTGARSRRTRGPTARSQRGDPSG